MSKLEELIQELCPDGVEYKKLDEICIIQNGYTPSKKILEFWENGNIPWFRMEDIRNCGHILNDAIQHITKEGVRGKVFPANSIIFATTATVGEHALIKVPFVCNQQLTHIHINEEYADKIDIKYLYHYSFKIDRLCKINIKGASTLPAVDLNKFKKFMIPLPPLEVQQEIVRILDNFTELTAELTAELEDRKKQYEYYHDLLTDFRTRKDVKWCFVGDYFTFKNGINKAKNCFGTGDYIVNFTDVYNHRWITRDTLKGRVQTEEKDLNAYDAKYGDVFFTRTSETKEDIGMVSTLVDDIDRCVFSGFVLRARPKTDNWLPKFCSYYFSSHQIRIQIVRYSSFTTRALTSGPRLSKLQIPLISKEEQQRIVSILDHFDSLCNDISSGIPSEIEARQKQYEYYRDKLLTFEKLEKDNV